jgi:glucosamine-phosphate N-acetyltransferase
MNIKTVKLKKTHLIGVVKLLSRNLTKFLPKKKDYKKIWKHFSSQKNIYAIVAVNKKNLVVGFGSIFLLRKIRGGILGYIEDIVIDKKFQSVGLGNKIVKELSEFGKNMNCYKIALQCSNRHNVVFYEKCGYQSNGIFMQKVLTKKNK